MCADFVYLASASPRRRELLTQIGVPFQVLVAAVDESVLPDESPAVYVVRLAEAKAAAGWRAAADAGLRAAPATADPPAAATPRVTLPPVLAADTTVVLDGAILAKPADRAEGAAMLERLSDRTHQVLTAVALACAAGIESRLSRSEVTFRPLSAAEIHEYWDTGEPVDKAGGYAVQGRAAVFIASLSGSYSGVMGLPLYETAALLERAGVPRWRSAPR